MDNLIKTRLLIVIVVLITIAIFSLEPIPQDPDYHLFADQHLLLGVPNFWNVVSNIPFLLVGLAGFAGTCTRTPPGGLHELRLNYALFFTGTFLIGLGSAWYHLQPDNARLVWDRLPIIITIMAFITAVTGETLSTKAGRRLLWPLVITGMASVIYWYFTELAGHGDLRFYGVAQYLPMLLTPVILLLFESRFESNALLWYVLIACGLAKIAEHYDAQIYDVLKIISGHTLKHLIFALGTGLFYIALKQRGLRSDARV